jgi:glyoxylase-like metal-dependent hydrolase (beta-lactamase superfamily II)
LAKSPEARFADATEMGRAVAEIRQPTAAPGGDADVPQLAPAAPDRGALTSPNEGEPVEIAAGVFWVSRREGVLLERNTFLVRYAGRGQSLGLIIDPGPPRDLEAITANAAQVLGAEGNIDLVFLNHQDPDASANARALLEANPAAIVICSEDTWRLTQFYELDQRRFQAVERFDSLTTELATGHRVSFVPTPFCHFRGSVMLYDHGSRVLFSGDLLAGLSRSQELWADERAWEGIRVFQQTYMPDSRALRWAVSQIRRLDPPVEIIAPQHGGIISGDLVGLFLDRLEALDVGLDLYLASLSKENYLRALTELLTELEDVVREDRMRQVLGLLAGDVSSPNILTIKDRVVIDIRTEPRAALEALLRELGRGLEDAQLEELESVVARTLAKWRIDLPEVVADRPSELGDYFEE